jgi:hypothetical protein
MVGSTAVDHARVLRRSFRDNELCVALEQLLPGRSTPVLGVREPSKPLAELLQLLTHVGYAGTLRVASSDDPRRGEIGLLDGRVIHGIVGDETGMDALMRMSKWRGANFAWKDEVPDSVNCNVTSDDLSGFLADLKKEDTPDDLEELLERSRVQDDQDFRLTPFPRTPALGAGTTETEVEGLSDGEEVSPMQAAPEAPPPPSQRSRGTRSMSNNINETLAELADVDGFIAAAIVDSDSGMSLGTIGGNDSFDIDVAAATNTDVVQAKMRAVRKLELEDAIEDILITLDGQYHLIRPLDERPNIFFYLALNRDKSNLAMARMSVADADKMVQL